MYQYRSVCAGMMIGLGAILNLQLGDILGACFFSLGLLTVCVLQLDLFTGKFSTILRKEMKPVYLFTILGGNLLGIVIMIGLACALPNFTNIRAGAQAIMEQRAQLSWFILIARGVICGMCVQMAVDMWKKYQHPICAMMPIAAFVILGGAHCIADTFYWILGGQMRQIVQIFEVIGGNVIGAMFFVVASWGIPNLD